MTRRFDLVLFAIIFIFISSSCEKEDSILIETSNIAINTPPLKLSYYTDEVLDLSGLVITQTMTDGSFEEVPFSEFENKGIKSTPDNGTILTESLTEVTITHTATSKNVSFGLTVTEGISSAEDIYEQNNSCETATQISTCENITATINSLDDIDYYFFSATAGETIQINISNIPSNFLLKKSLYDINKNLFTSSIQVIPDEESNSTLVVNEDIELYLVIEVVNNEYSSQPYTLNMDNGNCN
ncbi:hypothetical protein [Aquimarina sp. 2201CG5-10]|uniref:hypothetical protein n=1 Tax=Aquimarina callyspongiae TaxID=3098150 RepID=UPI002AB3310F|nr:hypothetical protein [Aquimarina sp. 2201CG5-10]MDY8137261.1 hypothetical protein [Aquimarina sp. 2201CG5-10]